MATSLRKPRLRHHLAVISVIGTLTGLGCGGSHSEARRPDQDPVRRHDLETARAAAARADAQPTDAQLQRAAFDAAIVVFANKTHSVEEFERRAWPQIKPSVVRVLAAAEDCPTKLQAVAIYLAAFERDAALAAYLSAGVRACLTKNEIQELMIMISYHHERCPDALEMAGELWKKSPPGATSPSAEFAAVALGNEQVHVLDMVFDCTAGAPSPSVLSFADPKDIAEYRRYKEQSASQRSTGDARRRAADGCDSECLSLYGEPDGTCRQACRQINGGTSCYHKCSDDGAACFARCSQ